MSSSLLKKIEALLNDRNLTKEWVDCSDKELPISSTLGIPRILMPSEISNNNEIQDKEVCTNTELKEYPVSGNTFTTGNQEKGLPSFISKLGACHNEIKKHKRVVKSFPLKIKENITSNGRQVIGHNHNLIKNDKIIFLLKKDIADIKEKLDKLEIQTNVISNSAPVLDRNELFRNNVKSFVTERGYLTISARFNCDFGKIKIKTILGEQRMIEANRSSFYNILVPYSKANAKKIYNYLKINSTVIKSDWSEFDGDGSIIIDFGNKTACVVTDQPCFESFSITYCFNNIEIFEAFLN